MMQVNSTQKYRQRAPSKRALATRERVLDAAEMVFATKGFDGATIRDIAAQANEPLGTIHHHGGGKEALFHQTVSRRAETLSLAREQALEAVKQAGEVSVEDVLRAFFQPFYVLSQRDPCWRSYACLVAIVSADERWRLIAAECFDPTAQVFLEELQRLLPEASRFEIAAKFVFSVSALLALLTSRDRIASLAAGESVGADEIGVLIRFCATGLDTA